MVGKHLSFFNFNFSIQETLKTSKVEFLTNNKLIKNIPYSIKCNKSITDVQDILYYGSEGYIKQIYTEVRYPERTMKNLPWNAPDCNSYVRHLTLDPVHKQVFLSLNFKLQRIYNSCKCLLCIMWKIIRRVSSYSVRKQTTWYNQCMF